MLKSIGACALVGGILCIPVVGAVVVGIAVLICVVIKAKDK